MENLSNELLELFGENSSEQGLLSFRKSTLHQFAVLSSAYHQKNTIDFLKNSQSMAKIFGKEIDIANFRTVDYENKALRTVQQNLEKLVEFNTQIENLIKEVDTASTQCSQYIGNMDIQYYVNIINSLLFYLTEIKVRILKPAYSIMVQEIDGAQKLLDTIDLKNSSKIEITSEEIARMCEVLSWGLESPPGWKGIQSDTTELSDNLEKKLGSLKAIATTYSNF